MDKVCISRCLLKKYMARALHKPKNIPFGAWRVTVITRTRKSYVLSATYRLSYFNYRTQPLLDHDQHPVTIVEPRPRSAIESNKKPWKLSSQEPRVGQYGEEQIAITRKPSNAPRIMHARIIKLHRMLKAKNHLIQQYCMRVLEEIRALRDFESDICTTIQRIECRLDLIEAHTERNINIDELQARIEELEAQCAARIPVQQSIGENDGSDDAVNDESLEVLHAGHEDVGEHNEDRNDLSDIHQPVQPPPGFRLCPFCAHSPRNLDYQLCPVMKQGMEDVSKNNNE